MYLPYIAPICAPLKSSTTNIIIIPTIAILHNVSLVFNHLQKILVANFKYPAFGSTSINLDNKKSVSYVLI